ncbi:MAG TPA: hypothetical protein VFF52_22405 [Isosphaeraceae bacterium]|nr:hypothetical protein [Isosphaeraceae bacterium]
MARPVKTKSSPNQVPGKMLRDYANPASFARSLDTVLQDKSKAELVALVNQRLEKSQSYQLLEWLKDQAVKRKDWSTALERAEAMFRQRPGLAEYQMVRTSPRE